MDARQLLYRVRDQTRALEKARELYRDRLAPDFSPFEFIDIDEMKLSRIIASLLDPKEIHGQGTKFLTAFLDVLKLDWDRNGLDRASIVREESTDAGRRVDIIVKSIGWTLGVENKLCGAGDLDDQVSHYLDYLDRAASADKPRCLIYLSVNGEPPAGHSISSEKLTSRTENRQLIPMDIDDLIIWLQRCRVNCRAPRVAGFIEDFESLLEREFKGNRDMTERDQLVDLVAKSRDATESAMKIILAASDIKKHLFLKLTSMIQEKMPGWVVSCTEHPVGKKEDHISIYYPGESGYYFCVCFEGTRYSWLIYGICTDKDHLPGKRNIASALNKELGQGTTSGWPWWRRALPSDPYLSVEGDWGNSEAPWGEIVDGAMADKIIEVAKRVHDVLHRNGLLATSAQA